jgi:hypothetical protein
MTLRLNPPVLCREAAGGKMRYSDGRFDPRFFRDRHDDSPPQNDSQTKRCEFHMEQVNGGDERSMRHEACYTVLARTTTVNAFQQSPCRRVS